MKPTLSRLVSRAGVASLLVLPLGVMGVLTVTVLLPTLKNPGSKFYSSGIGYPTLQRLVGNAIAVQTVTPQVRSADSGVAAPGELVALNQVDVQSQVTGPVEEVFVVEGQQVARGTPLFRLQRAPFENAGSVARNNLAMSETVLNALLESVPEQLAALQASANGHEQRLSLSKERLNQLRPLVAEGAISRSQFYPTQDEYAQRLQESTVAKQNLKVAQTELEQKIANARLKVQNDRLASENAQRDLNNTTVYAPESGLVSQINIDSGDIARVRTANPFVTLSRNISFKAYIDQSSLNAIKVGDRAAVRLVAFPGKVFPGKVFRINPTVQTSEVKPTMLRVGVDRRYTYSVWISSGGVKLPPGVQGFAQFGEESNRVMIPQSSVIHLSGGEGMVMVNQDGVAAVKRVKLGEVFDNQRKVVQGLELSDQVIVSPTGINPGDRLKVELSKG